MSGFGSFNVDYSFNSDMMEIVIGDIFVFKILSIYNCILIVLVGK